MPFALASFMQIDSICLFQDNTSSIDIPRWLCNFSLWLFIMSGFRGKLFYGDLNSISSVLISFRLLRNHCHRSFSSWLTADPIVSSFFGRKWRLVSSAKWWIINFKKAPCKSLMYTRNNKGLNVEPYGTPQVTCLVM